MSDLPKNETKWPNPVQTQETIKFQNLFQNAIKKSKLQARSITQIMLKTFFQTCCSRAATQISLCGKELQLGRPTRNTSLAINRPGPAHKFHLLATGCTHYLNQKMFRRWVSMIYDFSSSSFVIAEWCIVLILDASAIRAASISERTIVATCLCQSQTQSLS